MRLKRLFISSLLLSIIIVGCQSFNGTGTDPVDVQQHSDSVKSATDQVVGSNNVIRRESQKIQEETGEEGTKNRAKAIEEETRTIGSAAEELYRVSGELAQAQKDIDKRTVEINRLRKEVESAKQESRKYMMAGLAFIGVLGVVSLGLSVYMFIMGGRMNAIALGAASLVVSGTSITLISRWDNISIIGFVIGCVIVVILAWQIWLSLRKASTETKDYKVAFKETVATTEAAKNLMLPSQRRTMFGGDYFGEGPKQGTADRLQSSKTKDLVKKERNEGVKI